MGHLPQVDLHEGVRVLLGRGQREAVHRQPEAGHRQVQPGGRARAQPPALPLTVQVYSS